MKTFFTKLFNLMFLSIFTSFHLFSQGISLSYERDLSEINYLGGTYDVIGGQPGEAILLTQNGYSLYYGREKTGSDHYIKLRNNNTIVWKTNLVDPNFITPYQFYENESGYFFVGDFDLSSQTGGIGKLNKSTGNFEVKRRFTDISSPGTFAINGTHGGNIIVGGSTDIGNSSSNRTAMIRVVNLLGDALATRTSNNLGGLWGSVINQIEKTNDNGYIASGFIYENTICGEPNNRSWWICKFNSNLEVVWSRKYGDGNGTVSAKKIKVLPNNEIVAIGSTYCTNGNGGGINNTGDGTWLVKLNASGAIVINKFIGSNMLDFRKFYSDLENACEQNLMLSGSVGSLLGSSYFVEKFDYNLNYIENSSNYFGPNLNFEYQKIGLRSGPDKSYLIFGFKDYASSNDNSFISKTLPDPSCGTNPPSLLCENTIGQYSICEDFEILQNGNLLPQGSQKFSLFSGQQSEQATVTTEKAFSDTKSLKFTNTSDIDFNIDRIIESPSRMEWMTLAEASRTGSWGLETSSPTVYALVTRLNNGQGILYTVSTNSQLEQRATFDYIPGQWYKTALVFNHNENTIEVWINNKMIYSRAGHASRQITDLNLYGTSGSTNNLFYVDNLLYYENNLNCTCTNEYDPVCVNGKEYSNICIARCAGYTENEWTKGPCGGSGTSLVFDIDDNVCGPVGQIVTIPVKVKGFSKVSSFQFTINIPDNTKGEITGIEKGNITGDLNFGLISSSTATVVWDNTAPIDVTDNTVVINIKVRIKSLFTGSTDINIVDTPTDISADQNNQTVKPSVIKGSFCATASSFKICGKITREDNVAVPNVIVSLTGGKNATATTNANGEYCFENLDANLNYTVKPSKNTDHKNGINGGDVTAMRQHILAIEKLNSPYKIIAADASKTNTINGGDVTEIRKLILALINQFSTTESWAFLPKSHVFTNPTNPFAASIPNTININNLTNDISDQNFIGIKIGDVNLSNNPSNATDALQNRTSADINLIVGSANVVGNQNFDIDITVRQFNEITTGQFSVNWNTELANFVSLKNLNTTLGLTNDNFNATQTSSGKLGFLWDSPTPINLPDNTRLFTISFKAKSNGIANISITDDPVGKYFENKNKESLNIIVTTGTLTVPTEDDLVSSKINVYPNPSSGVFNIESAYDDIKNLEVRSLDGRLVQSISKFEGEILDLSYFTPGNYLIQGFINEYPFTKKLVIIK